MRAQERERKLQVTSGRSFALGQNRSRRTTTNKIIHRFCLFFHPANAALIRWALQALLHGATSWCVLRTRRRSRDLDEGESEGRVRKERAMKAFNFFSSTDETGRRLAAVPLAAKPSPPCHDSPTATLPRGVPPRGRSCGRLATRSSIPAGRSCPPRAPRVPRSPRADFD